MRRVLPHPWISLVLFLTWPALVSSVAPIHLLGAAALAVAVPLAVNPFLESPVRLQRPLAIVPLALIVARDVIVANIAVARLILGPTRRLRPMFLEVPLDTRHPQAIAFLASIITMTPGTVSCDIDEARSHILVHALDAEDPARIVADIKARYERRLMEIFGC